MQLLREIMTTPVEALAPEATLRQAAQKMKSLDVGILPICQNDTLIGVITDRDVAIRGVADGQDPNTIGVSAVMTSDLISCYEDEPVEKAAKLMEEKQIRRLPIMDRDGRLVGIVSLGDVAVRHHDEHLSGEILERVSQPWM